MKSGITCFLLTSAFIGGLVLLSCVNTPIKEKSNAEILYEEVIEHVEERVLSDEWMEERIVKRWYEGHEYLVLEADDIEAHSFIHNPNCPCKLEK